MPIVLKDYVGIYPSLESSELEEDLQELELSLARLDWLEEGVTVNSPASGPRDLSAGTIDYCRLRRVQLLQQPEQLLLHRICPQLLLQAQTLREW